MNKAILIFYFIVLVLGNTMAQEAQHSHILSINYLQIKEEMNYGLVFRGPGIKYSYSMYRENESRVLKYSATFGFTYLQTREIAGGNINLIPVKIDYLFKGGSEKFLAGPFLIADYNYELYPDLQSGYSFWFTNFSLGGNLQYKFTLDRQRFKVSFNTSVIGFTSRPAEIENPYYFNLSIGDIVKYLHQDLTFGSWNRYNTSELKIEWQPNSESRFSFAYLFNYHGYYPEPEFSMLNQSISLIIRPKAN